MLFPREKFCEPLAMSSASQNLQIMVLGWTHLPPSIGNGFAFG
jgi:hypothetical protein